MLKEALQAAQATGAEVELVRLDDLDLETTNGEIPDDAWWFWERLMEADGLVAAAPIISRTIPGRLKVLIDLLLGPNADRAIVEKLLAVRERVRSRRSRSGSTSGCCGRASPGSSPSAAR